MDVKLLAPASPVRNLRMNSCLPVGTARFLTSFMELKGMSDSQNTWLFMDYNNYKEISRRQGPTHDLYK